MGCIADMDISEKSLLSLAEIEPRIVETVARSLCQLSRPGCQNFVTDYVLMSSLLGNRKVKLIDRPLRTVGIEKRIVLSYGGKNESNFPHINK